MALYRRHAVVVPLLGFGCGSIGGVADGSGLGGGAGFA
jgi:hypothetical protein